MIRILATSGATLALALATSANAQQGPWSFAVGAATDNRSKDISKSDGQPFVWGLAEWAAPNSQLYVAGAFETIQSTTGSDLELAVTAGLRPQLMGFDLDLSATHKYQVDANPGTDNDTWEFTADVERSLGPVSGRIRVQHSPGGIGSTEASTWVAARAQLAFDNRLTGSVEIGRREQDAAVDYTGWNVGVTYALTPAWEAELRYHATDADVPGEQYADALVAGISFAF